MNLPQYEWVQFKKAPLKLVIGQIRFTIIPRFEQKGFIADFQEAVRSDYPKVSRESVVTYQISPSGINPNIGEMAWRFSSKNPLWSVVVSESAITLEAGSYLSMHDFLSRFRRLLEIAQETLEITDRLRLGLRYINEVRYPGAESLADWQKLLNSELVGLDATNLLAGQTHHTLQEIQIDRPDGTFAMRHGLLNGSVVAPFAKEPPVGGRFYLIDLDYYDTEECDLDIAATVQQMQNYNDIMSRFFRWTLSEKLYTYLEPIYAQQS